MPKPIDQAAPQADPGTDLTPAQPFDIAADREKVVQALDRSPEIEALTAQIDVGDLETIVTFGAGAAENISKTSDTVLRSMRLSALDESSAMMNALSRIMGQFDMNEVRDRPPRLSGLFSNRRKQLDRILDKYRTMGDEVDKIYVQLRQYEEEIKQSNQNLEALFQANLHDYHELVKYIVAGEQGCREIADYIAQRQRDLAETGDQAIRFEIQSLQQAQGMLAQRTHDLRIAETVAMQSVPMLKIMQYNNMNLVRKINSAFIITLPVFKQALAQAVMLKRQRIQSEALAALDARTNEMLVKNAKNTAEQAKIAARLASGSALRTDTLETSFRTIMDGIADTRRLRENAEKQQAEDREKLEKLRAAFQEKYGAQTQR